MERSSPVVDAVVPASEEEDSQDSWRQSLTVGDEANAGALTNPSRRTAGASRQEEAIDEYGLGDAWL